ncbi:MAG TPA: UDP-N-acetylglucosamine 2-epimerase (non-hydrolyzing) [Oligoflexia bacterium]|nr:UDP-N-acetylglucosamine 2-epimerase (non-hydrolyzing) [Oligoflexia bacterium]
MGTRPEIIKLAPVIEALSRSRILRPLIISSGQHELMAQQAFSTFKLKPDINLRLMTDNQTPNSFLSRLLEQLGSHLSSLELGGCIVQGDTTTTLGGALTAFHHKLPLAHIEAGLRTYRMDSPFPEEMNRVVVSRMAQLHFCPTQTARDNLASEGITQNVFTTGNTVVDAALAVDARFASNDLTLDPALAQLASHQRRLVLVTGHRRENFDGPLESLCRVLKEIRDKIQDIEIVYPVHLNPKVTATVNRVLRNETRINLIPPVDYPSLIWLIKHAVLIISDSGGIQEEAPSFGVRVLVTRSTTERPEAIGAGCAILAPLEDPEKLLQLALSELAAARTAANQKLSNPFGDGHAAARIVKILEEHWG